MYKAGLVDDQETAEAFLKKAGFFGGPPKEMSSVPMRGEYLTWPGKTW